VAVYATATDLGVNASDSAMKERITPRVNGRHACKNFVVHLRLPFQLALAPFMLWGAALARTAISVRFVVGLVVTLVCFYGGTTAYNTHYDRDEGPVGGLAHPPRAGPWLLPGSLLLQAFGLAVAARVGTEFFVACLAFAILGVLYSHPTSRWKGNPWLSWLVVMGGQGAIGTAAGVVAGGNAHLLAGAALPMAVGVLWVCAPEDAGAVYRRVSRFQLAAGGAFGLYAVLRLCLD
jgi:hypothetical protein